MFSLQSFYNSNRTVRFVAEVRIWLIPSMTTVIFGRNDLEQKCHAYI